jgi:hypothetical protein
MLSTVDQKSAAVPPPPKGGGDGANHEIVIILNNGFAERQKDMPEMHFGQTVRYTTTEPGAKAGMVFPELSPYRTDDQTNTEIPDSEIKELVRPLELGEARFQGLCYLVLKNGQRVGWDPANPEAGGGVHRVSKP